MDSGSSGERSRRKLPRLVKDECVHGPLHEVVVSQFLLHWLMLTCAVCDVRYLDTHDFSLGWAMVKLFKDQDVPWFLLYILADDSKDRTAQIAAVPGLTLHLFWCIFTHLDLFEKCLS